MMDSVALRTVISGVYGERGVHAQNIKLGNCVLGPHDQPLLLCGLWFCVYVLNPTSLWCYGMTDMCL